GEGATAAAAAHLGDLAPPAAAAEGGITEIVEHRRAAPQLGERLTTHVAGGDGHVRARRHIAVRRDATVVLPRRARAVRIVPEERRRGIELPEDAPEVRCTLRADQQAVGT